MTIYKLPELPYAQDALAPYISEETIEYHYGKHHQAYADNLNKLIKATKFESVDLADIIKTSTGGIFNNAAQFHNHIIYWECMSPNGGGQPASKTLEEIDKNFGSLAQFKEQFTTACLTLFGSGWVWLAQSTDGTLEILQTMNADTPIRVGKTPLIACDVWEHSYYIDRRNNRAAYIDAFWQLINWQQVEKTINNKSILAYEHQF